MDLVSRAFAIVSMSGREWKRNHSCADSTFQRWWGMPMIAHRGGRWVRDLRPHSAPAMQRCWRTIKWRVCLGKSLRAVRCWICAPILSESNSIKSQREKGRHILFWKMAYYVSVFSPFSPGKILCNAGNGCVAFTKSKDEKSVLAKLSLKMVCVREQAWHYTWSDREWKVVPVLVCFYRSGVYSRLCPAPSNFRTVSRLRWCETISVRRLWQAECPAAPGLTALAWMFVTGGILIYKIWSV